MAKEKVQRHDTPIEKLHRLLDESPGMVVIRDRMGHIKVAQQLPESQTKRVFEISLKDGLPPAVGISVVNEGGSNFSHVTVYPTETGKEVEVTNLPEGMGAEDVVLQAMRGIEIMETLLDIPADNRDSSLYPRVYDWMDEEDLDIEMTSHASPEFREMAERALELRLRSVESGIVKTEPSAQNTYRYAKEVLSR